MSLYRLEISFRARQDAEAIYDWLAQRSPAGATAWYEEFLASLDNLRIDPARLPNAPESELIGVDLRQISFKTRKGNVYRILFVISQEAIQVAGVRGTGQDLASLNDLGIT